MEMVYASLTNGSANSQALCRVVPDFLPSCSISIFRNFVARRTVVASQQLVLKAVDQPWQGGYAGDDVRLKPVVACLSFSSIAAACFGVAEELVDPQGQTVVASVGGVEQSSVEEGAHQVAEDEVVAEGVQEGVREAGKNIIPAARQMWDGKKWKHPAFAREVVVSIDELKQGAWFTGKVVAVAPFGAFVDIGAFTNGLVHISQLKNDFINSVGDVVTKGQEVKVRVIGLDGDAGRISLSMIDVAEEGGKGEERSRKPRRERNDQTSGAYAGRPVQGSTVSEFGRPVRVGKIAGRGRQVAEQRNKPVLVKKGQEVTGVVKSIIRNGVFLSLDGGEQGFLRSTEATSASNLAESPLFQIGQSVDARVLRIEKGKIYLTTKKEVDLKKINQSINNNETLTATNPFRLAFLHYNFLPANLGGELFQPHTQVDST